MNRATALTLVELMVWIAMIGIIIGFAAPTYRDHALRSKIVDAVSLMKEAGDKYAEYYAKNKKWPRSEVSNFKINNFFGEPPEDSIIKVWVYEYSPVNENRPYIAALLKRDPNLSQASGGYLALVGEIKNNKVRFNCRTATTDNNTSIPLDTLPTNCRCNTDWNEPCYYNQ